MSDSKIEDPDLSDNETNDDIPKNKFYQSQLFAIAVVILICVGMFWYYQSIVAYVSLQGFWHISGNYYVLIDEGLVRIIELSNGGTFSVIFEDKNVEFVDGIMPSIFGHCYKLKRSNDKTFAIGDLRDHAFNKQNIDLHVCPATGTIQIFDDKKETMRLNKDNAMSSEYLSSK